MLLISLIKKKYAEGITFDSWFCSLRNFEVDEIGNGVYKSLYWDENLLKLSSSMELAQLSYEYLSNISARKLIADSKNR